LTAGLGTDIVFQNISTKQTDCYPEKPYRRSRGGQGEKNGTTRKWRRKTLKLLKTDSEMVPAGLAAMGKEKLRKSALKPLE
jgi:hypothetical protein